MLSIIAPDLCIERTKPKMENSQNLLKADDVTFSGQLHIPLPTGPGQLKEKLSAGAAPSAKLHAHIIEEAAEYALIEVTCSCGRKTLLKCEYTST